MKKIFLLQFILCSQLVFAQQKLISIAKVHDKVITLRWVINDIELYREANLSGFSIQKIIKNDFHLSDFDNAPILATVFPFKGNDSLWRLKSEKDDKYLLMRKILYPEYKEDKNTEESYFSMFLLSLELDSSFAKSSGLYFSEKLDNISEKVIYKISSNGKNKLSTIIEVNPNKNTAYQNVSDFSLSKFGKSVELKWNTKDLVADYSSYVLERSEDSLNFRNLMEQNYIPIASQYEKDKIYSYFTDSTIKFDKKYFYRITPIDHFGIKNLSSEIKSIYVAKPVTAQILIDTLFEIEPNLIQLKWHTDKKDEAILKYEIWLSQKIDGDYTLIGTVGSSENEFKYQVSSHVNYFKVIAKNKMNDSSSSWPELFLLPDRVAPQPVENLRGKIDSVGIVKLSWDKNTDSDLLGYRIFRSNAKFEEFVEITKELIANNQFNDSIYLETLTEKIYYLAVAVDSNFNNSEILDTLKLNKPDLIAPIAAPIINFTTDKNGIQLNWINSTSEDVIVTEIQSSIDNTNYFTIFKFSPKEEFTSFLDTSILFDKGNYYKTKVTDDAGNFTMSEEIYIKSQFEKKYSKIAVTYKVDREKKSIQLNWEKPEEKIYCYSIYKAKKGEPMRWYKTLNETSFLDTDLYISNIYSYSIKATLDSGKEILITENLLIEY